MAYWLNRMVGFMLPFFFFIYYGFYRFELSLYSFLVGLLGGLAVFFIKRVI